MENEIRVTKEQLAEKINEIDGHYQALRNEHGIYDPDAMYLKGHRDALLALHNEYLFKS